MPDTQPGREGVREMNSLEVNVTRAVMNICLLAGCIIGKARVGNLLGLQDLDQLLANLTESTDDLVTVISRKLGRSEDDALLLLHTIVLKLPTMGTMSYSLNSLPIRMRWEEHFKVQIRDVILGLEADKTRYLAVTSSDQGAEECVLQHVLNTVDADIEHLLQVREARLTVDSLGEWIEGSSRSEEAPTLLKVLLKEETLSVLHLLPQIIQLQLTLVSRFNKKVSLAELTQMKLNTFASQFDLDEHLVRQYVFAWNKLRHHVMRASPRDAEEMRRFCESDQVDERSAPATFLFPSATGLGVCATNLTRYMIEEHNALASPDLPTTPLEAVNQGHGIRLNRNDLEKLLLSHTTYSLQRGGHGVQDKYDLPGMEKQIREKYLLSKARIEYRVVAQVQFLENITLQNHTLHNKIKQCFLSTSLEHQLDVELRNIPDISRLIENLHVAREFLVQIGNKKTAEDSLFRFMENLRLVVPESGEGSAVRQLTLGQLDSTLAFLVRIRAERIIINGQNPFEQIVPVEYREDLPYDVVAGLRDTLMLSSPALLFPPLFNFTMQQLRLDYFQQENHPNPTWSLKDDVYALLEIEEVDEQALDAVASLPSNILLKHIVHFIIHIVKENHE